MFKTSAMKQRLILTMLILLLAGGTLSLSAQIDGQTEPEEKAPAQQPHDDGDNSSTPSEGSDDSTETSTDTPADDDDNTPFEYESSEQISEDLSVSFPVDI